jgi:hypothetical protein
MQRSGFEVGFGVVTTDLEFGHTIPPLRLKINPHEMRGQSIVMEPQVRKAFARHYSLQFDISNSNIPINWGVIGNADHPDIVVCVCVYRKLHPY